MPKSDTFGNLDKKFPCVVSKRCNSFWKKQYIIRIGGHSYVMPRSSFVSPGKLPGQVKPNNIRTTHFSRNKIYNYHFIILYFYGNTIIQKDGIFEMRNSKLYFLQVIPSKKWTCQLQRSWSNCPRNSTNCLWEKWEKKIKQSTTIRG